MIGEGVNKDCYTQKSTLYLSFMSPITSYIEYEIYKVRVVNNSLLQVLPQYIYVCLHFLIAPACTIMHAYSKLCSCLLPAVMYVSNLKPQ